MTELLHFLSVPWVIALPIFFYCCSLSKLCLTPCDHPGLPSLHHLSESAQTYALWVSNAIQPSHPLSPFPSCPWSFPASGSFPVSQLFASGGQSIGASASVLPMNIPGLIFRMDWLDLLAVQGTLKSLLQHDSLKASVHRHSACTYQVVSIL